MSDRAKIGSLKLYLLRISNDYFLFVKDKKENRDPNLLFASYLMKLRIED